MRKKIVFLGIFILFSFAAVFILVKKNSFQVEELFAKKIPDEVKLLREYRIPEAMAVKFGDVNGDGKMGFAVFTKDYSVYVYDFYGKELWHYQAPAADSYLRAPFEPPGVIWDFDQDGYAEVAHWRMIKGKEWLVIADGKTGAIKHEVQWPTTPLPHFYNNFRLAVAKLHPGYPDSLIVLTDSGKTISINAYNAELKLLWSHIENRLKDSLGHYLYPVDINGDGLDEIVVSNLVLDSSGKVIWNNFGIFPNNRDHVDSFRLTDFDGDRELELLAAQSDVGTVVYKALTGKVLWKRASRHTQNIEFGKFLANIPEPQIIATSRTYKYRNSGQPFLYGQTYWFSSKGELISKWPDKPLNCNPIFVKGDWRGNGKEELFWYKFHMNSAGKGEFFFKEGVYQMFEFIGNGTEQVITLTLGGRLLRVYGFRYASPAKSKVRANRGIDYLKNRVANHSYY